MADRVRASADAIARAWRRVPDGTFWLQFKPVTQSKAAGKKMFQLVLNAVAAADDSLLGDAGASPLGETSVLSSPRGTVISVGFCDDQQTLTRWMASVIQGLEDAGLT